MNPASAHPTDASGGVTVVVSAPDPSDEPETRTLSEASGVGGQEAPPIVTDPPARRGWSAADGLVLAWLGLAVGVIVWRGWWRLPGEGEPGGPGSETGKERGVPGRDLGIVLIGAAVFVWLSQILGVTAAGQVLGMWGGREDTGIGSGGVIIMIGQYLGAGLAMAFLLTAMPPIGRALSRDWRLVGVGMGLLGMLLVSPLCTGTGAVTEWIRRMTTDVPVDPVAHETLRRLIESQPNLWWWGVVIGVTVGAPVVEEIIYRGLLQNGLRRVLGSGWGAVLVTSVVFTIVHAGAVDWRGMPVLMVLSIGLGVVYARTGRLLAPIAMHSAFNALNIGLALWQTSAQPLP